MLVLCTIILDLRTNIGKLRTNIGKLRTKIADSCPIPGFTHHRECLRTNAVELRTIMKDLHTNMAKTFTNAENIERRGRRDLDEQCTRNHQ